MADIEAATAPPQAPAARRAAAAGALRGLLSLAADAVVNGSLAALWWSNAANAAAVAVRWACGEGSGAAEATRQFAMASCGAMGVLVLGAVAILLCRFRSRMAEARDVPQIGGGGGGKSPAAQPRRHQSAGARGCQDGLYGPVPIPIVVLLFVAVAVGLLMQDIAPAKGSREERVGSMLVDAGIFLHSVVVCFFVFPGFVIRVKAAMK
ncbi:hypothetical protein ACP70R_047473 [Stipagrostis hirtigluma subsp. patula]